jgi:hypothetical protein
MDRPRRASRKDIEGKGKDKEEAEKQGKSRAVRARDKQGRAASQTDSPDSRHCFMIPETGPMGSRVSSLRRASSDPTVVAYCCIWQ